MPVSKEDRADAFKVDRSTPPCAEVALLTGGGDRPYALGLTKSLIAEGLKCDFIGSDFLRCADLEQNRYVNFLNLRGDMRNDAPLHQKAIRITKYYLRLLLYTLSAQPKIFHILWNNKFDLVDRTLLMIFYKLCGKRIVMTVHNVNMGQRDGRDGRINRLTLRTQYHLCDHLFVHTERMRQQLRADFGIDESKVTVIPLPINDTVPDTALSRAEARRQLGFSEDHKVLLFYGSIAPYKGLNVLIQSLATVVKWMPEMRLVIAGHPRFGSAHWEAVARDIVSLELSSFVTQRIEFIPDDETEVYFKAADAVVLPYTYVFQSGVLLLGYSFGVPVIATDVGSLREYLLQGKTGYLSKPCDADDLAARIKEYFESEIYRSLPQTRAWIQSWARDRYSWSEVASCTKALYRQLLTPDATGRRRDPSQQEAGAGNEAAG